MINRRHCTAHSSANPRAGSAVAPVLFGIACVGVVLGTLFWMRQRAELAHNLELERQAQVVQAATMERQQDVRPRRSIEPQPAAPEPAAQDVTAVPSGTAVAANAAVTETAPSADRDIAGGTLSEAEVRRQRVEAQLAAGEFGPALETAAQAEIPEERTRLLQLIANAQLELGEFDGAALSIGRIALPAEREAAHRRRLAQQTLTGGGSGADFEPLMALIMQETSGPWEEIDGTGGTVSPFETGVRVDPNGMLEQLTRAEHTGRLESLGIHARTADLNDDMARSSSLRLVSLTRLEQEVARLLESGQPVPATMRQLAGLHQVRYVFVFPEQGEIVLGGPAEGWRYNEAGLPVGVESGRPTLHLDDLVTVLRTFSPDGLGIFNCLIVPRQEGLKAVKQFVEESNSRGALRPNQTRNWVRQLQEKLGLQDVEVNGVPADSRVARVIVEADYRMKLIGVGKLDGGPQIKSFFDLVEVHPNQPPPPMDALRWWLTMKYDAVLHSPDRDVFELQGSSVWCRSENELITADGQRVHTGQAEATNRLFAELFTKHYAELAERDIVFADLQNIFDLALAAALIQHEQLDRTAGWDRGAFASHGPFQTMTFEPPQTVMSVVNHRVYNGRDVVVQVAGGVRADLMSVARDPKLRRTVERLDNVARSARAVQLPEGRWWWDATTE